MTRGTKQYRNTLQMPYSYWQHTLSLSLPMKVRELLILARDWGREADSIRATLYNLCSV